MTLQEICRWIEENFEYFRNHPNKGSWKVSYVNYCIFALFFLLISIISFVVVVTIASYQCYSCYAPLDMLCKFFNKLVAD